MTEEEEKPVIRFHPAGASGNVFALIAEGRRAMMRAGREEDAAALVQKVTDADSYEAALEVLKEYVTLVEVGP